MIFPALQATVGVRRTTRRTRLWRAMRMLRMFDVADLSMSTETTIKEARQFVFALVRAGLAAPVGDQYRLIVNSGPKAPVIRQGPRGSGMGHVIDANTGQFYGFDGAPTPEVIPAAGRGVGIAKVRCKAPKRRHNLQVKFTRPAGGLLSVATDKQIGVDEASKILQSLSSTASFEG